MTDWLSDYLRTALAELPVFDELPEPDGGHLVPPILAEKMTACIWVSDELLMDSGVIPDTRPRVPVTPYPWRTRLRLRIGEWRVWLAERAYRLISGEDVPESEDEW